MNNYWFFIKNVRKAQGISQKQIASTLHITQSSIAQFENTGLRLSKQKILNMAPILNLNPDFIFESKGNPFKRKSRNDIIKMYSS